MCHLFAVGPYRREGHSVDGSEKIPGTLALGNSSGLEDGDRGLKGGCFYHTKGKDVDWDSTDTSGIHHGNLVIYFGLNHQAG